jgi:hypothetical protein
MFEVMKRNNVRYYFYIGGNDSSETAHIVNQTAKAAGYELRCFHVPKTIDNDLRVTDHCPGYGSAARFVASAVLGDDMDNRSLPGIKIDIIMGRHAGFLTAAAALGRKDPEDGPHLVYVPERPVTRERLRDDIGAVYQRLGRCVVAISEGLVDAADAKGRTFTEVIAEGSNVERDTHGNVQLSGSGAKQRSADRRAPCICQRQALPWDMSETNLCCDRNKSSMRASISLKVAARRPTSSCVPGLSIRRVWSPARVILRAASVIRSIGANAVRARSAPTIVAKMRLEKMTIPRSVTNLRAV